MLRHTLVAGFLSFVLVLGGLTAAAEEVQPPHDDSNGISCLDCHALGMGEGPYGVSKPRGTAQELLCKSCHNPTGQASGMPDVGLHVVDGGATIVDCGSCHSVHYPQVTIDPHDGSTAPNLSLIRGDVATYVDGAVEPAIFQAPTDYAFDTAPFNGVCQACHQATQYHRNDGSAPTGHGAGQACTSCHGHTSGFPGTCTACHAVAQDNGDGLPADGRRALASEFVLGPVHSHMGGAAMTGADCVVCHSGATHADGNVDLANPDDGALLTFPEFAGAAGTPVTGLSAYCADCHDADGAAAAAAPLDPFGSGFAPPDVATEYFASGHADTTAQAFNYASARGTSCAKCHTEGGFLDWLGVDGSAVGVVNQAAQAGTWVTCMTCHNTAAAALTSVTFPSTAQVTGLGPEAVCLQCHQGRESTDSVDTKIATAAPATDDTVVASLSFSNVHYFAAGATLYGGAARGAYQYAGQVYDGKNAHVADYDTCIGCHDQHGLELKIGECSVCHDGVASAADTHDIRMFGSTGDYDGDGDVAEGVAHELEGLAAVLYQAIQAYGLDVAGQAIGYDSHAHPYFFKDLNGDGVIDATEAVNANRYNLFTARLLRACYNYQYYQKDPGAFAHNPRYMVQVLFDSITDLNSALATPVPFAGERDDTGHFAVYAEPWRHWDGGTVQASCAKCHSAGGFQSFVATGTTGAQPPSNGLTCLTCHTEMEDFETVAVASVTFPGGTVASAADPVDNICATCHSGRESKATVDANIASGSLSFRNVHYLPAAATLFGADAHVGYEYDGRTYAGTLFHVGGNSCVGCHDPEATRHSFDVLDNQAACAGCHGPGAIESYRLISSQDFDGDGSTAETLGAEVEGLEELLYVEIQAVAAATGNPIVYDSGAHPYWFKDTNGNGVPDPGEAVSANQFRAWTPGLLKAAFNYQLAHKEPGAWAHNIKYIVQLLHDSIEDLGGDVTGLYRP